MKGKIYSHLKILEIIDYFIEILNNIIKTWWNIPMIVHIFQYVISLLMISLNFLWDIDECVQNYDF